MLDDATHFVYTQSMTTARDNVHRKKKKMGRPATGHDPLISARIPTETVRAVEAWARRHGFTRSKAIAMLVEAGLKK